MNKTRTVWRRTTFRPEGWLMPDAAFNAPSAKGRSMERSN